MTEHKHAVLLRAIADEGIEATKEFECMRLGWTCENWALAYPHLNQITHEPDFWQVRRKAKVIRIGAVEFPEPVREPLTNGEQYFVVALTLPQYVMTACWCGDTFDANRLKRGLVHLTEEAAKQHAKALIKLSGGTV